MNNDRKRYIMVFAVAIALNLIPVIASIMGGSFITDGQVNMPVINFMVLMMLFALFVTFILKHIVDKRENET